MKNLSIYVIVDKIAENILSVFSSISVEMAKRQYDQALESNKDKIFDPKDIVLMVPYFLVDEHAKEDDVEFRFSYSVPETYEEVNEFFVPYG